MKTWRQPPCEAVSWNMFFHNFFSGRICQPPCEAVSWNNKVEVMKQCDTVSLLVRLWVEISRVLKINRKQKVSLLVRLWVEISSIHRRNSFLPSASLWGCELKYFKVGTSNPTTPVSLLVRLWVEIPRGKEAHLRHYRQPPWVLRCLFGYAIIDTILVSLFERLWIEKRNTLWLLYLREN